jgi:hypothetical protein
MSDDGEQTYSQRLSARMQQEMREFEQDERAQRQAQLDHWVEQQRLLNEPLDDGYVEIAGFRERRRPTCHRGPRDSDWSLR